MEHDISKTLNNPFWRLNNIYAIVDKKGSKIKFEFNWAQLLLYRSMWYLNIILKARQLGISTFISMLFLDKCLFNENVSAGILAHTQKDGEQLFRRIKFAFDNLPPELKKHITADNESAQMLKFSNGSSLIVGTSLRGSTFQYLHISEFGKICSQYPDKAREIVTGSLNTIAIGQYCFIESTAEGREGYFYEMCQRAQALKDSRSTLTKQDYKFHFYPWHGQNDYRNSSIIHISEEMHTYFNGLLSEGIRLDDDQKYWYINKARDLKDDMKREFPSTPNECWEVSNEGTYYGKYIVQARLENRICLVPYDDSLPVHTAWDLGYNDSTSIIFFQVYGKEIRIINAIEGSGESLTHWINIVLQYPYTYGKHLAPHDIQVHEYSSGISRLSTARKLGLNMICVPKVQIINGIDKVRNTLQFCYFDKNNTENLIKCLENYKKEWNDKTGTWMSTPLHNWASHSSDAFRTLATGLHYITSIKSEAEKEREKLENLRDASGLLPGNFLYDNQSVHSNDYIKNRFDTRGRKF